MRASSQIDSAPDAWRRRSKATKWASRGSSFGVATAAQKQGQNHEPRVCRASATPRARGATRRAGGASLVIDGAGTAWADCPRDAKCNPDQWQARRNAHYVDLLGSVCARAGRLWHELALKVATTTNVSLQVYMFAPDLRPDVPRTRHLTMSRVDSRSTR